MLKNDEFLVLNDHEASFNGRYFRAVDERFIAGRATHLQFSWRKRRLGSSIVSKRFGCGRTWGDEEQDKRLACKPPAIPVCTSVCACTNFFWPCAGVCGQVADLADESLVQGIISGLTIAPMRSSAMDHNFRH